MITTHHGPHLVQLTQRFPFPINTYLVREEDGFTLIDTGLWRSKAILEIAGSLGATIRRIAITHAHDDHVGSLDALHVLQPNTEILIGEREARILAGDLSLEPGEQGRPKGKICRTQPTRLLRAGDRVGSLEVIAAPGHSVGQVAFLDARDGNLIVGDAMQTQGGVAVAGTIKPLFPFPAFATWNRERSLETVKRLRSIEPRRLAVGHGPVLEQPLAAMDRAIAEAEKNLVSSGRNRIAS